MTQFDKLTGSLVRQQPPPVQIREDEMDVLAIFRLFRRRIGMMVVVGALLMAAALPSVLAMKKYYHARTRVLISTPITTDLASSATKGLGQLDLDTEVERLLSRGIAERVIKDLDLADLEEFNPTPHEETFLERTKNGIRDWLTNDPPLTMRLDSNMDQVVAAFYNALSVQRSGFTQVIEIGFTSRDPELAARVPNALIELYQEEREQGILGQVSAAKQWFDPLIREQEQRVDAAEKAVEQFRDSNGLESELALADAQSAVSELSKQRADLMRSRAELLATLAALEDSAGQPGDVGSIDSEIVAELHQNLMTQQRTLSKLREVYGENHKDVISSQADVQATTAAISDEVNRQIRLLKAHIEALDNEQSAVTAGLNTAREKLSGVSLAGADLAHLARVAGLERSELDDLQRQRRAVEIQGKLPVAEIEVLSPAVVPILPQGKGRVFYMMVAMVVAGGLAVTAAIARELLDQGVRSHQQLGGIAGIVPAGLIPIVPRLRPSNFFESLQGRRDSMFGEAMRGLVYSLERGGSGPRATLVTSPLPGDGKSFLSAALALELAGSGRKVLLVDTDLRHGRLDQLFRVPAAPGLSDVLAGRSEISDVIRHDEATGIDFIPKGGPGPMPSNSGEPIASIIRYAKDHGQVVIFDSAPVLALNRMSMLAEACDRTVVVLRWGRTRRRDAEAALTRLHSSSGDEVLVAINCVNPRRHALYGFNDAVLYSNSLRKYYAR